MTSDTPDDDLTNEEWHRRHWAEFPEYVARARAEAHWRILKRKFFAQIERLLNRFAALPASTPSKD